MFILTDFYGRGCAHIHGWRDKSKMERVHVDMVWEHKSSSL